MASAQSSIHTSVGDADKFARKIAEQRTRMPRSVTLNAAASTRRSVLGLSAARAPQQVVQVQSITPKLGKDKAKRADRSQRWMQSAEEPAPPAQEKQDKPPRISRVRRSFYGKVPKGERSLPPAASLPAPAANPLRSALEAFLAGMELSFSAHCARAAALRGLLGCGADGPPRSIDVLERCIERGRGVLSHKQNEVLLALQRRRERYEAGDAGLAEESTRSRRGSAAEDSSRSRRRSSTEVAPPAASATAAAPSGGGGWGKLRLSQRASQALAGSRSSMRRGSIGNGDARRGSVAEGVEMEPPLSVVVLGGGPIGLRAACEMALLGHRVTLLEARDGISRLNVLKLWEETTIDLDRLALKLIDMDWSNKKDARASTARLQLALMKVALLLGVNIGVDRAHLDFSLGDARALGADVLFVSTGFNAPMYARFAAAAEVAPYHEDRLLLSSRRNSVDDADADAAIETDDRGDPLPRRPSLAGGTSAAGTPFGRMPEGSRPAAAIAIVCHFECSKRTPEAAQWAKAFEPFDWTVQDAMGADTPQGLRSMQQKYGLYCVAPKQLREEGILLENMISYANKGTSGDVPPSFYFIFTLKADMVTSCRGADAKWKLIKMGDGAPAEGGSRTLLEWAKSREAQQAGLGLDQQELEKFARRVVHLFTERYAKCAVKGGKVVEGGTVSASLPESCALLRTVDERFPRSLDIFDFSERHCLRRACEVVTGVDGTPLPPDSPLLVLPVGDALQEPFWPEGLGVNRGMHNALDAAHVAHQWRRAQRDGWAARELVQLRQSLYEGKTLQMHGKNRAMLRGYRSDNSKGDSPKPAYGYSPSPGTRYNMGRDTSSSMASSSRRGSQSSRRPSLSRRASSVGVSLGSLSRRSSVRAD